MALSGSPPKVIFIGNPAVGKTSLMNALLAREVTRTYIATARPEFRSLRVNHNGTELTLHMWDTAGEEAYRSITKLYFRDAGIALVCFDITVRQSFVDLDEWITLMNDQAPTAALILVGTKIDLAREESGDKISILELEEKAERGRHGFIQTSAITNEGIDALRVMLAEVAEMRKKATVIADSEPVDAAPKGGGCC
jgi:small GTP-binding protein